MTEQVLRGFPLTSRFTLLPTPVVAPGKCAVCGTVDKPVVDFNLTIDFYGAVLLCDHCLREAASGVGMVSETLLDEAREELAQSFESQLADRNMVAVSNEFVHVLSGVLTSISDSILPASNRSANVAPTQAAPAEPTLFDDSPENAGDDTNVESSDTGSSEQDDNALVSEGPVSISASDEHGDIFRL